MLICVSLHLEISLSSSQVAEVSENNIFENMLSYNFTDMEKRGGEKKVLFGIRRPQVGWLAAEMRKWRSRCLWLRKWFVRLIGSDHFNLTLPKKVCIRSNVVWWEKSLKQNWYLEDWEYVFFGPG